MRTAVKHQTKDRQFTMRLTREERAALQDRANELGVSATDVLRMYIRNKLLKVSSTVAA